MELADAANTKPPTDLITPNAAAVIAKMTASTIRKWIADGRLAAWRVESRWFVSQADVEAMVVPFVPATGRPKTRAEVKEDEERIDRTLRTGRVRR